MAKILLSKMCSFLMTEACPAMPAWTKDQLSDHRTANRFVVPYPEPALHCFFSMKKGIKVSSRYWVSSRLQYVLNIVLVTIWKFRTWIIWEGFLTSIRAFLACRSMCFYIAFEDEIDKTNCEQFTIQTCRAHDDSSCWVLVLILIPASFRKYVKGLFYSRGSGSKNFVTFYYYYREHFVLHFYCCTVSNIMKGWRLL